MAEATFPTERFTEAGATDAETAQLGEEFSHSDIIVKAALVSHFESVSNGDLREYLGELRGIGHFTTSQPDDGAVEPVAPTDDPGLDDGAAEAKPPTKTRAASKKAAASTK